MMLISCSRLLIVLILLILAAISSVGSSASSTGTDFANPRPDIMQQQMENAKAADPKFSIGFAVRCREGTLLAKAVAKQKSKTRVLEETDSTSSLQSPRLFGEYNTLGMCVTGLPSDARFVSDTILSLSVQHSRVFNEPISCQQLAEEIGSIFHKLSLSEERRALAVSIILASIDELVHVDCTGAVSTNLAWCRTDSSAADEDSSKSIRKDLARLASTSNSYSCDEALSELKRIHSENFCDNYDKFDFQIIRRNLDS